MSDQISGPILNVLILCQQQFGYHVDTFFYCKYLRERHNITYLCWDYGHPRQEMEGVSLHYVSRAGNIACRNIRYLKKSQHFLRHNKVDVCFIKYFRGCSLLRLSFPKIRFVFDIRTGNVGGGKFARWLYDNGMRFESSFFKHITVISHSLAKKLGLSDKAEILPLGSVPIDESDKYFERLDLLYVGTLTNRKIGKTIAGFADFVAKSPPSLQSSYVVIGSGFHGEEEQLKKQINELGLQDKIRIVGKIPFSKLQPYFAKANIGVSFVPITSFFDVQPVTKTFDYLLSGMPVLATATAENKKVIHENNGVLVDDTAIAFAQGLEKINERLAIYNSRKIMADAKQYHWRIIVNNLEKYLQEFVNGCGKTC